MTETLLMVYEMRTSFFVYVLGAVDAEEDIVRRIVGQGCIRPYAKLVGHGLCGL
jgi:hypothetical protein